ncbi:MAG: thiazole biosynthesis protein [Candidatus Aminicenantes bacterium]|nr:thiazole biosynthesis protein [Candidatus Aminicenantes bacterium]
MNIDDIKITRAIIEQYFQKFLQVLELEVALVGAGPSNLICGTILGEFGVKSAIFESKLSPGGGMWGGGMMFNEIVVQEQALPLLDKIGIGYKKHDEGYFVADSIESTSTLVSKCVKSGTKIFNLVKVVDVIFAEKGGSGDKNRSSKKVNGLVLNWSPVEELSLHVDPLSIRSTFVVDGTGHSAEVCSIITRKMGEKLATRTGQVIGEMSMCAEKGEELTVENSVEIFPGLYVTGMAANASKGSPRMGPIFGGMLLSGEKVAKELISRLKE